MAFSLSTSRSRWTFPEEVATLVAFVRASERIRAQVVAALNIMEALRELAVGEPFLEPEIGAASDHLCEAADAMTRMVVALDARDGANTPTTDEETEGSG